MPALRRLSFSRSSGCASGNLDELSQNDNRHFAPYDHPIKPAPDYVIKTELISTSPSLSSHSGPSAPSSPQSDLEASFQGLSVQPALGAGNLSASRAKKNHGRRREAGYVPRPRNSFMVFRSEFIQVNRGAGEDKQQMLSKQAGKVWATMSETEKIPYRAMATTEQRQHKLRYPNYQYTPGSRRTTRSKTTNRRVSGAYTASSRAGRAPVSVEDWSTSVPSLSEQYSPGPESISSRDSLIPRAVPQVAVQRLQQIASSDEIVPSVLDFCQDSLPWDQFSHHHISPMVHYDPLLVEASPPTLDTYTQRFGINEHPLATLTADQSVYTSEWETNSQFLIFGSTYSLYPTTPQMSDVSQGREEEFMTYFDLSAYPSAS